MTKYLLAAALVFTGCVPDEPAPEQVGQIRQATSDCLDGAEDVFQHPFPNGFDFPLMEYDDLLDSNDPTVWGAYSPSEDEWIYFEAEDDDYDDLLDGKTVTFRTIDTPTQNRIRVDYQCIF